jgi:tetratricopeptide (TPR) repeat protein
MQGNSRAIARLSSSHLALVMLPLFVMLPLQVPALVPFEARPALSPPLPVAAPVAPPLLSVCMIVKNEEANLPRALASAAGLGAELVVVDTGSTDATVEVAMRAGARVVHFVWVSDFSAARNFAFASASGQWLLVLDADEELTPELKAKIAEVLATSQAGALRVPMSDVDDRGALRMRFSSTRIIRNGRGYAYEGSVHEDLEGSVLRAGDTIEDVELPILHHGYSAAENTRKNRHERNMELVQAAHEAAPSDPRHWHYLGLQHAIAGDHDRAAPWFERVVSEAPDHELAGWSASQLAAIRVAERAYGAAWEASVAGARPKLGRVASLLRLGEIALREGDGLSALEAAKALDQLPAHVEGDSARRREATLVVRARATALTKSPRESYAMLLRAVKAHPNDAVLADELVKMAERSGPRGRAGVTAAKDTRGAPAVVAAGIGAFVRQRAWTHAVTLAETHGVRNEYYAHALARVGRVDESRALLTSFGESAAEHLLLSGLEANDDAVVAQALAMLPACAAAPAKHVRAGQRVPRALGFWLLGWMELCVAYRADAMAARLASSLPATDAESRATLALLLYEGGEPMEALELALACSTEPDALEVIGLVAHDKGDLAAAGPLLAKRARAGDCSVRVALRGGAALRAIGQRAAAEEVLAIGRASRPHARSLAA